MGLPGHVVTAAGSTTPTGDTGELPAVSGTVPGGGVFTELVVEVGTLVFFAGLKEDSSGFV